MIKILYSIILLVLIDLSFLLYYKKDSRKDKSSFKEKIISLFIVDKKTYWLLGIMSICGIMTFVIGQYLYGNAELLMSLRWQVAMMTIVPIASIDYKEQIIPNKILLITLGFSVVLIAIQLLLSPEYIINYGGSALVGALFAGSVFLIASLIVKNGIGAGDVKMFLVYGLLLAFRGIFNVLLYSMIISAFTGIILVVFKKKKAKDVLPLAPFTLLGVVLAIAFGV